MHFKHNNKTENEIENKTINPSEENEVFTDEELIANKKNNDILFNEEADVLLGKNEKKPQEQHRKEHKVEDLPQKQEKIEVVEEIAPYVEESIKDEPIKVKELSAEDENYKLKFEELQVQFDMLEEKNHNLARILKDLSVELKEAREESEKQFEVIGKLASEKKELEQSNKALSAKANKLEYDVEVKDDQLSAFKQLGDEAGDIQSQLFNYKETAKSISDQLKDKKDKIKEYLTKIKDDESTIRELEEELNKVKDEKDSLATIVIQQKQKLENNVNQEIVITDLNEKNVDYKDLYRKQKAELEELNEQIRSKDRLIIRQISEKAKLNKSIDDLNDSIIEYQDKVDELFAKANKNMLEMNSTKNFIKGSNNGTILGRVMENELDLKLKNFIPVSKEKMVADEEVSSLLEKIDNTINNTKYDNKPDKQYKFEIFEGIQTNVIEFINNVVQKEAIAYDYIVAMNDFEYEKEKLVNSYEDKINNINKQLKNKESEINNLKIELFNKTSITDDNRTILEYKEDNKRLNKQIEFLKSENLILSNEITDEAINHLAKAFETERDSNRETEKLLKTEITTLNNKLVEATKDLEKLNGEYVLTQFNNELNRIDKFISNIENGDIQINSNLLDAYYKEAYEKFSKQTLIYNDEISKRDELLKILLDDKSEDLGRMVEQDINGELGDDNETKERIKHNEKVIDAIENILGSKIIKLELDPKNILDKHVFEIFKETYQSMYQNMIKNINDNAKAYTDELTETSAVKAMELFNNDVNKMAKYYSEAVNEAYLEQRFDTNEFSKLLDNAKLAILCNEFATLIKFKEEKSREKFNGIYHENGEYGNSINNNFGGTLEEIKAVKAALSVKQDELNQTFNNELIALNNEIETIKQQIQAIKEQIDLGNNDTSSLNIDLDAKIKVLNYLENEKKNQIIDTFNKQIQDIKLQLETIDNSEHRSKEDFIARSSNEATFNKDMNNLSLDINDAYGIKEINQYLLNLNNIEIGYFEAMNNNDNEFEDKINSIHDQMTELNNKAGYYRDLVLLKNDLTKTANVMKTNYSQIRDYENIVTEANYLNKQVEFYNNEIAKAKEKIANDIDVLMNKDSILMYQAKLLNLNALAESKNEELEEIKNYYIVSQYVNVIDKINHIDEIIKEKGKEID